MKYLIKNCKVIQKGSKLHGKKTDILISNGKIESISKNIDAPNAKIIKGKNLHVSVGWMDIGTHLGEPGYEHRETFESLADAALAGGYTDIATMPKSVPVIQTKAQIKNLISSGKAFGIDIHPMAALSNDLKGENITEFIDMHNAGAVGFTDGLKPVSKSGLLMRALQYVKSFGGIILHHPNDDSLANGNQIHEGNISTKMGMKGSPSLAEELTVHRDTQLNNYTESKLCVHLISSKESITTLKNAKKKDKNLKVGVAYLNLIKNHEDLQGFDSNLKVIPILRGAADQKALKKAVVDDTIDYISSNHVPLEVEQKHLEFPYAAHGAIGLETCFAALNTYASNDFSVDTLVDKLTNGPRNLLGANLIEIESGNQAKLTVFDPSFNWTYNKNDIKSLSENSPFIGSEFSGKVIATINGSKVYIA